MHYWPEVYQYLIKELDKKNIKHVVHEFNSGAIMLDIWDNEHFYVFQIEEGFVGFSDDETPDFSTAPDVKLFSIEEVKTKLKSILG